MRCSHLVFDAPLPQFSADLDLALAAGQRRPYETFHEAGIGLQASVRQFRNGNVDCRRGVASGAKFGAEFLAGMVAAGEEADRLRSCRSSERGDFSLLLLATAVLPRIL